LATLAIEQFEKSEQRSKAHSDIPPCRRVENLLFAEYR
jgi:hypothetical protein